MELGSKIRFARRLHGRTLKEVADLAQCSESLLSRIENGRAAPSLKTLQRLATALGFTVSELFEQEGDTDAPVMAAAKRLSFDDPQIGDGSRIEPLAANSDGRMLECTLLHLASDASSGEPATREGEQFGYVLEGEIELVVDGKLYRAAAGDSINFRTDRPHSWRCRSAEGTKIIWVNTPRGS
ncbi:helix-turn-helix domain-containing protein [Methyloligella solikamskensis]|uniref:Helix-turn-helix domain-containing protein n=1 Tax=Methyloligella solikamskensis TaxID=1177756 RepID=A0ABW3J8L3_9HYPH